MRECKEFSELNFFPSLKFRLFLAVGDHKNALFFSNFMNKRKKEIGYFYSALYKFLFGDYIKCISLINRIKDYEKKPDIVYLKVHALFELKLNEEAWTEIENISRTSKRIKTWAVMADLVKNRYDYYRMSKNLYNAISLQLISLDHIEIVEHLSRGALRAKLYDEATKLWVNYKENVEKKIIPKKRKVYISQSMAETALYHLKNELLLNGINIFLISGTLLGFYRNNKILSHDKDMDVGVWENVDLKIVKQILSKSGFFYIQPSRSKHVLRVKHLSGLPIDIFKHYRNFNDYWHAGVKVSWHNSPFELKKVHAFGDWYYIPSDEKKYLEENYGNWRIEIKNFDSAQDTPNLKVLNENELLIHRLRKSFLNKY